MPGSQWDLGMILLGMLAGHVLLAYHVRRRERAGTAGTEPEAGGADLIDTDEGTVECPDCGTENDLGYRFCRACVTELPGTMPFDGDGDSPLGRFAN